MADPWPQVTLWIDARCNMTDPWPQVALWIAARMRCSFISGPWPQVALWTRAACLHLRCAMHPDPWPQVALWIKVACVSFLACVVLGMHFNFGALEFWLWKFGSGGGCAVSPPTQGTPKSEASDSGLRNLNFCVPAAADPVHQVPVDHFGSGSTAS